MIILIDRYEKPMHCDILVAGGGAVGLMAAFQAASGGAHIIWLMNRMS